MFHIFYQNFHANQAPPLLGGWGPIRGAIGLAAPLSCSVCLSARAREGRVLLVCLNKLPWALAPTRGSPFEYDECMVCGHSVRDISWKLHDLRPQMGAQQPRSTQVRL